MSAHDAEVHDSETMGLYGASDDASPETVRTSAAIEWAAVLCALACVVAMVCWVGPLVLG